MPRSSDADPLSRADAVRRAAGRVHELYPRSGTVVVADDELIRSEIEVVVERLTATLDGRPQKPLEPGALDRLRIIELLRTEILRAWEGAEADALAILQGIEVVQAEVVQWRREAALSEVLTPFSRKVLREVSHMLRSPLGSIVMLADTMREAVPGSPDEGLGRQLGIIQRAALGMAATASDLLTLVSDADRCGRTSSYTVHGIVAEVADIVRPVAEALDWTLVLDAHDDIERSGPASALRQVLLGLAVRAALQGRSGVVEIAAAADGDRLDFVVTTRPGDPPDAVGGRDGSLFTILRSDGEEGGFTLSPDGIAVAAAAEILAGLGSDLEVDVLADGGHRLCFALDSASA